MGRDSNPRSPCELSSFQDCRLRPLGHPSDVFFYVFLYASLALFCMTPVWVRVTGIPPALSNYRCLAPAW